MKSIMISINPKWVEKIATGEKTIELRKSAPKKTPFKAYIYETKSKGGKGKIVGEFVCREVEKFTVGIDYYEYIMGDDYFDATCLEDRDFLFEYGNSKPLYGMFITDLKLYDTPKELSDFKMPYKYDKKGNLECGAMFCPEHSSCGRCVVLDNKYAIKRPPQSWCYCEVQE